MKRVFIPLVRLEDEKKTPEEVLAKKRRKAVADDVNLFASRSEAGPFGMVSAKKPRSKLVNDVHLSSCHPADEVKTAKKVKAKKRRTTLANDVNLSGPGDEEEDNDSSLLRTFRLHSRIDSSSSKGSRRSSICESLSANAREALRKLDKKVKINPFDVEYQSLITEFSDQVQVQSYKDADLTEAAGLLDGVRQVYNKQAAKLHDDVLALAEFTVNSLKVKKDKLPRNSEDVDESQRTNEETNNEIEASTSQEQSNVPPIDSEVHQSEGSVALNSKTENTEPSVIQTENQSDASLVNGAAENLTQPSESEQNLFLQSLVLDHADESQLSQLEGSLDNPLPDLLPNEDFNAANLITSTPIKEPLYGPAAGVIDRGSRKPQLSFRDLLNPACFKVLGLSFMEKRNQSNNKIPIPPPVLVPYFDIPIVEHDDNELPPPLESSILPKPPMTSAARLPDESRLLHDINQNNQQGNSSQLSSPNQSTSRNQQSQAGPVDPSVVINNIIPKGLHNFHLSDLDLCSDIKSEDLIHLHTFIQQLHYLSFTNDLTNGQKSETFTNAVKNIQNIFKNNNCPLETRQNGDIEHNPSSSLESAVIDPSVPFNLESFHESFRQACDAQETCTVMQRTKEKTRKESKSRLKEMLTGILGPIVRKHYNKALSDEHSESFFKNVETFKCKMKKILVDEEQKKQFDLPMYEKEVLEVANKDFESEEGVQVSPTVSNSFSDDNGLVDTTIDVMEPQSPCRSESSSNSNGLKWIPLSNIFSHLRNKEGHEAARYFCALLGLLSFQNLDINYDTLYSVESANKVTKALDHTQDLKYPRGAKIVNSRCPDIDKDEVYVAALSSISRTETFRQLENGISPENLNLLNQEEFLQAASGFNLAKGSFFEGELFSKRARARENKKLLLQKGTKKD